MKLPSDYIREGWTQGFFAETINGRRCSAYSDKAVKVCAYGGILRAAGLKMKIGEIPVNIMIKAFEEVVDSHISGWNDRKGRTQQQVIVAMRKMERQVGLR